MPIMMRTNVEMLIPRFPNGRFPHFCLLCHGLITLWFRMKKKELAEEMKTMYDFPYVHIHRRFDVISSYNKRNLTWFLHVQSRQ